MDINFLLETYKCICYDKNYKVYNMIIFMRKVVLLIHIFYLCIMMKIMRKMHSIPTHC